MSWLKVAFTCRSDHVDSLADFLQRFSAQSISFTAGTDEAVFADGIGKVDRYWDRTIVSALFPADIDIDILIACVRNRPGAEHVIGCRCEPVQDENWLARYRENTSPMIFADRLCISPGWCVKPADVPHVIELDPGLAFGSGNHATTAMCLQWLAENDVTGCRVIDYGCGSGVLGLAAAKLGAAAVFATDIDPQALQATRDNAARNRLSERITTGFPDDSRIRPAEVLLANILLGPLLELPERFTTMLNSGGRLVLSGLLLTQLDQCLAAYSRWFDMHAPVYRDEWIMLSGVRKPGGQAAAA